MEAVCCRSSLQHHSFSVFTRLLLQVRHLAEFSPKRIVVLNKTSRLKYEKRSRMDLSETELRDKLMSRGSDYDGLRLRHEKHSASLEVIQQRLASRGIQCRVRERETYTREDVGWAEAVLTAGGDGTFLYGASLVLDHSKPVVGINTDPDRSEGVLCVRSSQPDRERDIPHIMDQVLSGHFKWAWRHRIRIHLNGVLVPYYALNEVFIGEKDPTRTAYYELQLDSGLKEKQKSSGLVVYTGSGSSAWVYNIHRLLPQQVKQVLATASGVDAVPSQDLDALTEKVTSIYNERLAYDGSQEIMSFVVREAIEKGIFSSKLVSGKAKQLQVRSRAWKGTVIVDAHKHLDFCEGATVSLSMSSKNAVKTISIVD